eukprot:CAMPEP_0180036346 /NCGR_PEP_ID=MMETSP0984-20121128/30849_1 /TAXON_ID=483367 /ORGANISM="non described non described, Strain CCMP 2436" /LENGTH=250 /DNA_ID=CAMNT_0021962457 /DNA_START=149 /DNA_END=899 /DNA_ORIENTATION=+
MHVIGQFNNGFILTRLRERQPSGALSSDLFIIDQHAASEKANFERLSSKTSLGSQRLLCPLPLELAPAELEAVRANLPAFEAQGFQILLDEEAPAAQRAKLAAVPFCKRASFGVADVHELLALLLDAPAGASIQLPKLRAILASRACHSAVVIGDALQPAKMAAIVRTLSTLEQPWNCPHGRPTIRHVAHLGGAQADYYQARPRLLWPSRGSSRRPEGRHRTCACARLLAKVLASLLNAQPRVCRYADDS